MWEDDLPPCRTDEAELLLEGRAWNGGFSSMPSPSELDEPEEEEEEAEELEDSSKTLAFFRVGGSGVGLVERSGLISCIRCESSPISDSKLLCCLEEAEPAVKDVAKWCDVRWVCDLPFDFASALPAESPLEGRPP